jgi:hypothetical protein
MQLSTIATITSGHPFRGSIPEKTGSDIRVVQMKDISPHWTVNWRSTVESEPVALGPPNWLRQGDILVAGRGNRNYAVLIDNPPSRALASPHFFVITVNTDAVLPEFLAWQLNQEPAQRYLTGESEGTLTKSIRRKALDATPIAVPSMQKQRQIIGLQAVAQQKRQLYQRLIRNEDTLMAGIAAGLLHDSIQE